jgi:hypothetical protein
VLTYNIRINNYSIFFCGASLGVNLVGWTDGRREVWMTYILMKTATMSELDLLSVGGRSPVRDLVR